MANMRYGLKEVANVIFFDLVTNKPVLFFDTLKVSSIENESESAEARGGPGNNRLMVWDFGRTSSLTLQDALLSDTSLALLAGSTVKSQADGITAVGRETLKAVLDGTAPAVKVVLKEVPIVGTVSVWKVVGGIMSSEIATFTIGTGANNKDIKVATGSVVGEEWMVFYNYTVTDVNASMVTFSGSNFPSSYKVVGDTVVRGQHDGKDRKMQFIIPNAKLQSTFSLTMDAENVSTFDFNLDILVQAGTNKLYDIIRLDTM